MPTSTLSIPICRYILFIIFLIKINKTFLKHRDPSCQSLLMLFAYLTKKILIIFIIHLYKSDKFSIHPSCKCSFIVRVSFMRKRNTRSYRRTRRLWFCSLHFTSFFRGSKQRDGLIIKKILYQTQKLY